MGNKYLPDLNGKKILFLIPAGLGDYVKSLGIFLSIKKQYPEAIIDVAVTDRGALSLSKFTDYIDNILILKMPKFTPFKYWLYFCFRGWSDFKMINKQKYDFIISLTINPQRKFLLALSKAKNKFILPLDASDVVREYAFISELGIEIMREQPQFFNKLEMLSKETFSMSVNDNKKNIIVNMFCADSPNSTRDWQYWGKLIDEISNKFNIILIGKVDFDYKRYYHLDYSKITDFVNKIDLKDLVYLFQKSNLVVTVDSFPFHLAYAVGTPVLGLFGLVDPETRIPPSVSRKNIHYLCGDKTGMFSGVKLKKELKKNSGEYMKNINPKKVIDKIYELQSLPISEN